MNPAPDEDEDENEVFALALLNAMTSPLSPRDEWIAGLGYTCGYVPAERLDEFRRRELDKDWY